MFRARLTRLVRCTVSTLGGLSFRNKCMSRPGCSFMLRPSYSSNPLRCYFYINSVNQTDAFATQTPNSAGRMEEATLSEVILAMNSVPEVLETYKNFQDTAPMVQRNRVTVLYHITNIIQKDELQKVSLNADKSPEGERSLFLDLIGQISKHISESSGRDLASIVWCLGRIGSSPGKQHALVNICVKEILSRDITAFDTGAINQILTGLAALNIKKSKVWTKMQNGIITGEIQISDFNNQELIGSLGAFAKTGHGSPELFELYREEIYLRGIPSFSGAELSQLVFSFAKRGIEADKLFSHIEQEILRKGLDSFCDMKIFLVLWAFANSKSARTYNKLFNQINKEIVSHGVEGFKNSDLSNIVWCFSKVGVYNAKVYDIIKDEILVRGLDTFHRYLLQLLWSFAMAKKEGYSDFNEKAAKEFLSIVTASKSVEKKLLCEYAWCFGRLGITDEKVYQAIEMEFLGRNITHLKYMHIKKLLSGFSHVKKGSREFWEFLENATLQLNFSTLKAAEISSILLPFAEMEYKSPQLYDVVEKEIVQRGESHFTPFELKRIKTAMLRVGRDPKH